MMRVLVTGGAGFIASHITDRLIQNGHSVAVIDNLSSGLIENVNLKARFYNLDICDLEINKVFDEENPEIVIHHAAQINVQNSQDDKLFDCKTNIMGSLNVFENSMRLGVDKVIYSSSAAVYGEPKYLAINEQHPVEPLSYYGISKHTPEHYLKLFCADYGMQFCILRYANVYGPRQGNIGEGGVVSIFSKQLLDGSIPTIYGSGLQIRDFIYVEDVVDANIKAIHAPSNDIINISCNNGTSIIKLFNIMKEQLGSEVEPNYEQKRPGDILNSYLDNKKALKILKWRPHFSLHQGLKNTLGYESEKVHNKLNNELEAAIIPKI